MLSEAHCLHGAGGGAPGGWHNSLSRQDGSSWYRGLIHCAHWRVVGSVVRRVRGIPVVAVHSVGAVAVCLAYRGRSVIRLSHWCRAVIRLPHRCRAVIRLPIVPASNRVTVNVPQSVRASKHWHAFVSCRTCEWTDHRPLSCCEVADDDCQCHAAQNEHLLFHGLHNTYPFILHSVWNSSARQCA